MTENQWDHTPQERELLTVGSTETLIERFKGTPVPLTRRIALLARIDEKAARAYAAQLQAKKAVIEEGISLARAYSKAMNIDFLIERDAVELKDDLAEAKAKAERSKVERTRGEVLGEIEYQANLTEATLKLKRLQRTQKQFDEATSKKPQSPLDRFKVSLGAIKGSEEADGARKAATLLKKKVAEAPNDEIPDEDKASVQASIDYELEIFLEKLRKSSR